MEIFFGQGHVHHSRTVGGVNSFQYPSFYLLFPCHQEKALQVTLKSKHKGILSLQVTDYLQGEKGSLEQNIKNFLKEKCGYVADEVWLHTMPRMFGYAFNPVSFWICRRNERTEAVLVEVKNTFKERHFYWIRPESEIQNSSWYRAEKVFHVSPFFPVEGFYQFRFQVNSEESRIDINYHGTDGQLNLATWVQGVHFNVEQVSLFRLLAKYGWMTPMVVGRIHWQAVKLWLRKNKFHSKPALPSQEVSHDRSIDANKNVSANFKTSQARNSGADIAGREK